MKYSQLIFKKTINELTYQDVADFFSSEKEEDLKLEFKSYPTQGDHRSKESSVLKAICGLLNSEGGIVIWGAPTESRNSDGNTTATGELTPFQSNLDRDRLINIISSSIVPLPLGVKIQQLSYVDNRSIFIIEVEKSMGRPHQYDNRYYIRLDGQTRIAPHYIISAMMKSVDFPVLRGHLRLKRIDNDGHNFLLRFKKLVFNTSAYINDINLQIRLIASPGNIFINNQNHGASYIHRSPVISNGSPLMSNFILVVPARHIHEPINIMLQFGGEKSPSKISSYKYNLAVNNHTGDLSNDDDYIIEKSENKMPADTSNNTDDENITILLNLNT